MDLLPAGRAVARGTKNEHWIESSAASPARSPSIRVGPAVLMVGNFLSSSIGTRSVCEDLAKNLSAEDWVIITTSDRRSRIRRLVNMAITVWSRRRDYVVGHVDVFSGLAFFWAEVVCRLLRLAHKPYVLTLHGGNLPAFGRRFPRRVRSLLCSAAAVTTPSHYLLDKMQPYRYDLRLIPNPLDVSAFQFRARDRAAPRLIWLRTFHALYNPSLAVRVAALLAAKFPDVQLIMIGPDRADGSLLQARRTAAILGIEDRVTWIGPATRRDVPVWLSGSDIFLNTANIDNTPVSVLEAMACGLCIVSTDVGGLPYLLDDGMDALLVPPDSAEAMASAVERVLNDPALAGKLSRNARRKTESFAWPIILPQWQSLFVDVLRT
jgi:glycosyltransferase involved in cell wall biosynthesis